MVYPMYGWSLLQPEAGLSIVTFENLTQEKYQALSDLREMLNSDKAQFITALKKALSENSLTKSNKKKTMTITGTKAIKRNSMK